jgi:predicted peptidase
MGHSMGAIGTWRLAARHPDIWAGLGPIAGFGDPSTAATIQHIPQIVVHGDADRTVPVTGSRMMVEALRKLEAEVTYIEVPGGGHSDIAPPNMAQIFEFFNTHRRSGG